MNWKELMGKRVLVRIFPSTKIREVTIVDVSKSGRYVKIRNEMGITEWVEGDMITILDEY